MPAAIDTMFCSATPTLKNRSGCLSAKSTVRLACARSAVRTTMRGSESASSASTSPATKAGIVLAAIPLSLSLSRSVAAPLAVPRKTPLISCPASSRRVRSAIWAAHGQRLETSPNLGDDVVVVGTHEVADMPLRITLHPSHAPTLDGVGDQQLRWGDGGVVQVVEGVENRVQVVSVDRADPPAEALKSRLQRLESHDALGVAVDREMVAVHDPHQRPELELARGHGRLPDLAFVEFAIAHHAVHADGAVLDASTQRHPDADRKAVSE